MVTECVHSGSLPVRPIRHYRRPKFSTASVILESQFSRSQPKNSALRVSSLLQPYCSSTVALLQPYCCPTYISPTSALLQPYLSNTSALLQLCLSLTCSYPSSDLLQPYFSSTSAIIKLYFSPTSTLLQLYFSRWASTAGPPVPRALL